MSYCIRSNQHAFFLFVQGQELHSFFSSITDQTKSGKFRICFKTEPVIKADYFYLAIALGLKL
jgi:hypothetical protein